jgi:uncharacterized membrane protein
MLRTTLDSPRFASKRDRLIRLLPLLILLAGIVVLALGWGNLPNRWVNSWDVEGRPDRWAPKSISAVFLPIAVGAGWCLAIEAVSWLLKFVAQRRGLDVPLETGIAVAKLLGDSRSFLEIGVALACVVYGLAPLATSTQFRLFHLTAFVLIGLTIVVDLFLFNRGLRELKHAGHKALEGHNGVTYNNPKDPRLFVPTLLSSSYTLNFAHKWAWPILIAFFTILLGYVLLLALKII